MQHATSEINNRFFRTGGESRWFFFYHLPFYHRPPSVEIFNSWPPRIGGSPCRPPFYHFFFLPPAPAEIFNRWFFRMGGGPRRPFLVTTGLRKTKIFNCWPPRIGGGSRRPSFLPPVSKRPNFNCWPLIWLKDLANPLFQLLAPRILIRPHQHILVN